MNIRILHPILILATIYLVVFCQSTFGFFRYFVGAQPDLVPGLIVYATLSCGLGIGTLAAVCGGLWFDSLSWNPFGISILGLFLVALVIERYRGLILRDQIYAQFMLGLGASAATPLFTLVLLLNSSRTPLIGWASLWQWLVVSVVGGLFTPLWFRFFGWLTQSLSYETLPDPMSQGNREIKRGRN